MKAGDRVEFHIKSSTNTSSTTKPSADASAANTQKDTLSLGLGLYRRASLLVISRITTGFTEISTSALAAVFNLAEVSPELQLLSDVRAIFRSKNNPEYFATSDLLAELREMENRPWSAWGPKSGRRLAGHLRKFEIGPRPLHYGSPTGFKGYRINDLQDAWDRYLPPSAALVDSDESAASRAEIGGQCGINIASASSISANGAA